MSFFRYRLFQFLILLAFAGIVARLFYFQILNHEKHKLAVQKFHRQQNLDVLRGDIVDRYGKILALDMNKYALEYNPVSSTENRRLLSNQITRIINDKHFSEEKILKILNGQSSRIIARELNKEQAEKIRALKSKLITLRRTMQRYYPQKRLASHLLGYVDLYGKARQGLESKFEKFLTKNPETSLELSLDSRLQALVEHELEQHIKNTEAARGTVIVMKVNTGEILSWATFPNFNPNNYYDFPYEHCKNWALTDVYQPGSIFKTITVSTALDSGTIDENYKFLDKGYLEIDKRWKIKNHDYNPNDPNFKAEELDLTMLFARSSNPFAAHVALQIGASTFFNYIKLFGFGNKTNIELNGETKGLLKKYSQWRDSDTAATGIGHGAISVTPLQVLSAVNVIANDGTWVKPTLLKKQDLDSLDDDKKLPKNKHEKMQVIKSSTAKTVRKFMADAIEYNLEHRHAQAGRVAGLRVAGKTGTAEKIKDGSYSHKETVASFLGFFPAERPRYIALVVIDDPKTDGRWGDSVAGPLFNRVAKICKNLYL